MMKYAVVTGGSKGLGAKIVRNLLENNVYVISVSRGENEEIAQLKQVNNYQFFRCNLASPTEISNVFEEITKLVFSPETEGIYLVNNAGVIDPIETAGNLNDEAVLRNVQINLTAPIQISNLFLQKAKETNIPLMIANVTSGAGERPVHGWSLYCSTKAGINMFTKTVSLELENHQSPIKIFAYSPGIMDTEMQQKIRSSSEAAFAEIEKFQGYKEKGMLRSPQVVANALVTLMMEKEIENGKVYHVNELL
ncbi:(S)-benzoin forming benzil reductase [Mesobacillus maritimus]|uniref:(S)-benzoin forming benzil reductase n=1 Tax=Mesobacillus maritimus TaxID=1643336 RepID=UPI00203D5BCC|nr:(S)-benzoin forming benzil reductase [Mesobacillus maritimus]MCM3585098.1 (S)-benzoin forming benzil reductase [Mesobacillus maritimus]